MRLFEIEDEQQPNMQDDADQQPQQEDPLSADVSSLLLRLDASQVKKVKIDTFINELNNILNVPIDVTDQDQLNNIKTLISNTGKADINGDYIIMDYQAPESSSESDVEKIAMKNIKDKA